MQKMEAQKTIPSRRDEQQSAALVWIVTPLLATGAAYAPVHAAARSSSLTPWIMPLLLSAAFAVLVSLLKAATWPAAAIGFLVCTILAQQPGFGALLALVVLFLLTFAATRSGRSKKELQRLAEGRSGRRAAQIVANLGVAALCASMGWYAGCIAALAEAAADTVSSEIGQAVGGQAWLITSWRRVPGGTDGGISVAGTAAGVAAAALVVAAGTMHSAFRPDALLIFAAACAGLLFDSVLGATVERIGWLGNDLVNFSSTLFAAMIAVMWLLFRGRIL
ncbi:DUF92 domain-containing protein [Edaphobacter paludis]|uniref:DUF92 domain-containing protein n=1 Tax=Edaphobacter paludis TaxID=3035702 RepID=A0AAU7D4Y0_9BACT